MADNGAPKEEGLFYTKDMTDQDHAVDQASFSSIVVF